MLVLVEPSAQALAFFMFDASLPSKLAAGHFRPVSTALMLASRSLRLLYSISAALVSAFVGKTAFLSTCPAESWRLHHMKEDTKADDLLQHVLLPCFAPFHCDQLEETLGCGWMISIAISATCAVKLIGIINLS